MNTLPNKVIWHEGLFIQPQHLQQQTRYFESLARLENGCQPYRWGFFSVRLDPGQLALGKVALNEASGIFPDGTPFLIPDSHPAPAPVDIPTDNDEYTLYLGLPIARAGDLDVDYQQNPDVIKRYQVAEAVVSDTSIDARYQIDMQLATLQCRLLFEGDSLGDYHSLEIGRLTRCRASGRIELDRDFIPPALSVAVTAYLPGLMNEVQGLLRQQAEQLMTQLQQVNAASAVEMINVLRMTAVNRGLSVLEHLLSLDPLHPERFYLFLRELVGELHSLSHVGQLLPELEHYHHRDLHSSFAHLMKPLRQYLSRLQVPQAQAIELAEPKFGVRKAVVHDRSVYTEADIVLAVSAEMSAEPLRAQFLEQARVGAVENIHKLVNFSLSGIELEYLPVIPSGIPLQKGFHYFRLDNHSSHWPDPATSSGFGIHIDNSDALPNLQLELWAVRNPELTSA